MIALLQRVKEASVQVDRQTVGEIKHGLLILLGISVHDTEKEAGWLAKKVANLRIFSDGEGKMNRSLIEVSGEALVISQFTLLAEVSTGNRPSYIKAARPEQANPLYVAFVAQVESILGQPVKTGVFGADMQVSLVNDGPVTVWVESK